MLDLDTATKAHPDQAVSIWGDSDIPYLQQMTKPSQVKNIIQRGIFFSKIGAKSTETSQPLDLGQFFNMLKATGRAMTSIGQINPSTLMIDYIFRKLAKDKQLHISNLKSCALKDFLCTAPNVFGAVFNKDSSIKVFVDSEILDRRTNTRPDMYGIINSFKINWTKVPGGRKWLMDMNPLAILKVYKCGQFTESFYDLHNLPIDCNHEGNKCYLKSNTDNSTHSKIIYHSNVISKKQNDISEYL